MFRTLDTIFSSVKNMPINFEASSILNTHGSILNYLLNETRDKNLIQFDNLSRIFQNLEESLGLVKVDKITDPFYSILLDAPGKTEIQLISELKNSGVLQNARELKNNIINNYKSIC